MKARNISIEELTEIVEGFGFEFGSGMRRGDDIKKKGSYLDFRLKRKTKAYRIPPMGTNWELTDVDTKTKKVTFANVHGYGNTSKKAPLTTIMGNYDWYVLFATLLDMGYTVVSGKTKMESTDDFLKYISDNNLMALIEAEAELRGVASPLR